MCDKQNTNLLLKYPANRFGSGFAGNEGLPHLGFGEWWVIFAVFRIKGKSIRNGEALFGRITTVWQHGTHK
jgi:hypothetical protein